MVCKSVKDCPSDPQFWQDNEAFKKAMLELVSDIAIDVVVADVTLAPGNNHIGSVCIDCPLPAGDNNIGNVDVLTLPAITGTVDVGNFPAVQTVAVNNFPATQPVSGTVDLAVEATIGNGRKTVTTAGTAVTLAASTAIKRVDVQALSTNTGLIAVGSASVIAGTGATRSGIVLAANQVFSFSISNLASVFIDSTVNGEGVSYTYFV